MPVIHAKIRVAEDGSISGARWNCYTCAARAKSRGGL
jgi:hypothetical protein